MCRGNEVHTFFVEKLYTLMLLIAIIYILVGIFIWFSMYYYTVAIGLKKLYIFLLTQATVAKEHNKGALSFCYRKYSEKLHFIRFFLFIISFYSICWVFE